jgi:hypothetical protein
VHARARAGKVVIVHAGAGGMASRLYLVFSSELHVSSVVDSVQPTVALMPSFRYFLPFS